ncbi:hypothetical protein Xen7305DRAFT_00013450 [Xenococcus sp. PCC 7305]|nr:hypothetical protein Xen7305DRAFT_00013450 [Xenococcus sp. PCC 7305]
MLIAFNIMLSKNDSIGADIFCVFNNNPVEGNLDHVAITVPFHL